MTQPTKIPVSLGGSGKGIHYWQNLLHCERQYWLDQKCRETGWATSSDDWRTQRGTAFHALMAYYYRNAKGKGRALDTESVRYVQDGGGLWDPGARATVAAERAFRAYRAQFPATELGRVLDVEEPLSVEAGKYEFAPGGLTGNLDLVVKCSAKDCERLQTTRRLTMTPGIYIVDHKLHESDHPLTNDQYRLSLQWVAYCLLYQMNHKVKPAGFLYNLVFGGGSRVGFRTLAFKFPDEGDIQVLTQMLHRARAVVSAQEEGRDWNIANPLACIAYGRVCSHYTEGRCPRF